MQVDVLTEEILKLSENNLPTANVVNQLSLDADRLLDVPDLGSLLPVRDANDILLAIEKVSDNFNASWVRRSEKSCFFKIALNDVSLCMTAKLLGIKSF